MITLTAQHPKFALELHLNPTLTLSYAVPVGLAALVYNYDS